jgi:hypothetical protein
LPFFTPNCFFALLGQCLELEAEIGPVGALPQQLVLSRLGVLGQCVHELESRPVPDHRRAADQLLASGFRVASRDVDADPFDDADEARRLRGDGAADRPPRRVAAGDPEPQVRWLAGGGVGENRVRPALLQDLLHVEHGLGFAVGRPLTRPDRHANGRVAALRGSQGSRGKQERKDGVRVLHSSRLLRES